MSEEPTLKQYNFLKSKGKWVDNMTKQQAHEAIAAIIPPKAEAPVEVIDMTADTGPSKHSYQKDYEKPKKEYNLTDGNVRIGALEAAQRDGLNANNPEFWARVGIFEDYIRNGK